MTNFKYSTIKDASKWNKTDAPVTLYFEGEVNEETLSALELIIAQFERGAFDDFFLNPWMKKLNIINFQQMQKILKWKNLITDVLWNFRY